MTPMLTRRRQRTLTVLALLLALANGRGLAADPPAFAVPKDVQAVLTAHCNDCHAAKASGGVRLDDLASLKTADRLDLLNKVQDQLFFRMMPPSKEAQPTAAEAKALADWVRAELRAHKASKLDDHLPYPDAGNYVDHMSLFDGSNREKPFTPARRWLVSPQIFVERVLDVFQLEGRDREHFRRSGFYGVTNPFVLPDHAGVRYYDLTRLDGGHLLTMLGNAEWIAGKQIQAARVKAGDPKAVPADPKDKWAPKTPPAFEVVVFRKDAPTDEEIRAAVRQQFALALRRPPTDAELGEYLALTRNAVKVGGNTGGLREMLKAVLLQSEFVYRLEFGTGKPDQDGRVPLAPREAAFALAYALGDRGPDAELLKAAESGKLSTKADYEREVKRMLADTNAFRGPVDATFHGGHLESHVTSHPKLVRFFREFFGYPGALKLFKDKHRSGGYYMAPDDHGNLGTLGWLVQEADEFVIWQVNQDRRVFERLLTSDEYFVYHNMDTKAGQALIAQWKEVYDTLKDTPWKTKPQEVIAEHEKLLLAAKILNPKNSKPADYPVNLRQYMFWFQDTFGQGRTPFTLGPCKRRSRSAAPAG